MRALLFVGILTTYLLSLSAPAEAGFRSAASRGVPRLHVVLIASWMYTDEMGRLEGPRRDIAAMEGAIKGLGSRVELASLSIEHNPTREAILSTLIETAAAAKKDKIPVAVYWSGHSNYDSRLNRLYLTPVDARRVGEGEHDLEGTIDLAADIVSVFGMDTDLLLLADGCNVGEALMAQIGNKFPNLTVMAASKVDEKVVDILPQIGHGAFSYYLAEALRESIRDIDGDGLVSVDDIFMHVYPRVVEVTRNASLSVVQHPALFGRFSHKFGIAAAKSQIASGERIVLPFVGGVPEPLRDRQELVVNGSALQVAISSDHSSLEVSQDDSYKIPAGLSEISLKEEGKKFLVWKERGSLARFEVPYKASHAVLIAIDDYNPEGKARKKTLPALNTSKDGRSSPGMVAQSRRLAAVLREIGFTTIVELYDSDATKARIDEVLQSYWTGGENEAVDRLFVHFGGHGLSAKDASGRPISLLATHDYDLNKRVTTTYHTNDLKGRHSENIAANHLMIALDVCHSGLVTTKLSNREDSELGSKDSRLALVRSEIERRARNFLVAGTSEQEALFENGGVFTERLIEALGGQADEDKDGLLTFSEIGRWVKKSVIAYIQSSTTLRGQRQEPDYEKISAIGRGEMLFFPPPARIAVNAPAAKVSIDDRR